MYKKLCFSIFAFSLFCGEIKADELHTQSIDTEEEALIAKTLLSTPEINPALESALVRTIVAIEDEGSHVRLSDGSLWDVAYYFGRREVRKYWAVGDRVVLSTGDAPLHSMGFLAMHNLSKGLSIYLGLSGIVSNGDSPESVKITQIDVVEERIFTDKGIVFHVTDRWKKDLIKEFIVGDVLQVFMPQSGTLDGTKIFFINNRFHRCFLVCPFHSLFSAEQEIIE